MTRMGPREAPFVSFVLIGSVARQRIYLSAASINRASPFSAILSHCQPTVSFTGFGTDGVVATSTTSRPAAGVRRLSGLNDQTRPSSSVTVRVCTIPHLNVVYPNGPRLMRRPNRLSGNRLRGFGLAGTPALVTPFFIDVAGTRSSFFPARERHGSDRNAGTASRSHRQRRLLGGRCLPHGGIHLSLGARRGPRRRCLHAAGAATALAGVHERRCGTDDVVRTHPLR